MTVVDFLYIVLLFVIAVINIIFFCKMWTMTNNVAEILQLMKNNPEFQKKKQTKPIETSPTDDIRIWVKENKRVKVTDIGKAGLLCKGIDDPEFFQYIPESELRKE